MFRKHDRQTDRQLMACAVLVNKERIETHLLRTQDQLMVTTFNFCLITCVIQRLVNFLAPHFDCQVTGGSDQAIPCKVQVVNMGGVAQELLDW